MIIIIVRTLTDNDNSNNNNNANKEALRPLQYSQTQEKLNPKAAHTPEMMGHDPWMLSGRPGKPVEIHVHTYVCISTYVSVYIYIYIFLYFL